MWFACLAGWSVSAWCVNTNYITWSGRWPDCLICCTDVNYSANCCLALMLNRVNASSGEPEITGSCLVPPTLHHTLRWSVCPVTSCVIHVLSCSYGIWYVLNYMHITCHNFRCLVPFLAANSYQWIDSEQFSWYQFINISWIILIVKFSLL